MFSWRKVALAVPGKRLFILFSAATAGGQQRSAHTGTILDTTLTPFKYVRWQKVHNQYWVLCRDYRQTKRTKQQQLDEPVYLTGHKSLLIGQTWPDQYYMSVYMFRFYSHARTVIKYVLRNTGTIHGPYWVSAWSCYSCFCEWSLPTTGVEGLVFIWQI